MLKIVQIKLGFSSAWTKNFKLGLEKADCVCVLCV